MALSAVDDAERLDAQFFRKRFLSEDVSLGRLTSERIGSHAKVTDGPHGYHEVDEDSPIAMLTAKSAANWFATRVGADNISAATHAANMRSSLEAGDVILGTRGTIGRCALVTSDVLPANIDQDVARIALAPGACWLPEFVITYLNSRFGQDYIERHASGMVQQGLSLAKVRDIPVPVLGTSFQQQIQKIVSSAKEALDSQSALVDGAQSELLDALGLRDWSPPEPLTYTRPASAVAHAGRLDAQFHAPAVLALRAKLEEKFELMSLGALGEVTNGRTVQYSEQGSIPIIRSGDVGKTRDTHDLLQADVSEPIFFIRRGDVLISSIGFGSIGRVEAIDTDISMGAVSEVTVLRQRRLDPHYVTAFLRSFAGQVQLERLITGATGQLHLYPRDVRTIFVPFIDTEVQEAQRTSAEDANLQHVRAALLLETAKRAVEIAVEEGEASALRFIAEEAEKFDGSSV